jgi:hypothetical protein
MKRCVQMKQTRHLLVDKSKIIHEAAFVPCPFHQLPTRIWSTSNYHTSTFVEDTDSVGCDNQPSYGIWHWIVSALTLTAIFRQ